MKMKRKSVKYLPKMLFLSIFLFFCVVVTAQDNTKTATRAAQKYLQDAEAALAENNAAAAEAYYRKAIAKDPENAEAKYNLGNLYYNKDLTSQALTRHRESAAAAKVKPLKHNSYHNEGNSYMKQEKYSEAVEAYKQSLRNNPNDEETRYNLALAKKLLEEELKDGGGGDQNEDQDQQDQQDQQEQDGEGDKEQNEDGKPKDEQGGDKKEDENKEGEQKKDNAGQPDENEEEKNEQPKEGEQPQQPQQRPGQLSPQQVKNLLEAMGNEEKKVQEKMNAKKAKGIPIKTEKDW